MSHTIYDIECDILVVGGGLGGAAAAIRAARMGSRVCLAEENHWLGGQCTSQGASILEEHPHIDHFGGTALYGEFRAGVRAYYHDNYLLAERAAAAPFFNPGATPGNRLGFEPQAGLAALLNMVVPLVEARQLQIFYHARALSAEVHDDAICCVILQQGDSDRLLRFHPAYVLDATELGDLLPLLDTPFTTGAEAQEESGEPHAHPDGPAPQRLQSFAFPFVVDLCPGADHTIPRPPDYEKNSAQQPFALPPTWTHNRILAAENFAADQLSGDLIQIHWPANAFRADSLIDKTAQQRTQILQQAKNLSFGLLHWLQTAAPRADGQGCGYPELRLRGDVLGTADGLSQYPHIRESRRIKARTTLLEQQVSALFQPRARAAFFADAIGLGFHPIDIDTAPADSPPNGPTRPFQIPLGILLPQHPVNLLPASKNAGFTHITNGCCRQPPTEWSTGEAAGALASFCLSHAHKPAAIHANPTLLRAFQRELLGHGISLYWYDDLPRAHPAFAAVHLLALEGIWPGHADHLHFEPNAPIEGQQRQALLRKAGLDPDSAGSTPHSRGDLARLISARLFDSSS